MTYKEGDVVRFSILNTSKKHFKEFKIGVIDKIVDDVYKMFSIDDYENMFDIKLQDIEELISKGEYELGEYVTIDFIDSSFACMICAKEETWDGFFYTVEVQNKKGEAIFFVDGLCNSYAEVDYRILWDHERNENY